MRSSIVEALQFLREDQEEKTYPKKCISYTYRIKSGSYLLCATFPSNQKYGFRVKYVTTYGPTDKSAALGFLTKEDAESFVAAEDVNHAEIYLSRNTYTLIRVSPDNLIPVYVAETPVGQQYSKLTDYQKANLASPVESANEVASQEIVKKNPEQVTSQEKQPFNPFVLAANLETYVADKPQVEINTPSMSTTRLKYKLLPESKGHGSTTYWLKCSIRYNWRQIEAKVAIDTNRWSRSGSRYIPFIPKDIEDKFIKFARGYRENDSGELKDIMTKIIVDKANIPKHFIDHSNSTGPNLTQFYSWDYKMYLLDAISCYPVLNMQNYEHSSEENAKRDIDNIIQNYNNKLEQELQYIDNIVNAYPQIEEEIKDMVQSSEITVTYDNFEELVKQLQ